MTLSQNAALLGALPAPATIRLLLDALVTLLALACLCRVRVPPRDRSRSPQPRRSGAPNDGGRP